MERTPVTVRCPVSHNCLQSFNLGIIQLTWDPIMDKAVKVIKIAGGTLLNNEIAQITPIFSGPKGLTEQEVLQDLTRLRELMKCKHTNQKLPVGDVKGHLSRVEENEDD